MSARIDGWEYFESPFYVTRQRSLKANSDCTKLLVTHLCTLPPSTRWICAMLDGIARLACNLPTTLLCVMLGPETGTQHDTKRSR